MQFIKLSLTALCLGLITACGGSGGGGDNSGNTTTPLNDNATSPTTNVDTPNTPNTETNNTTGQVLKIKNGNGVIENLNTTNLSSIIVDGQTIHITIPGINSGTWAALNNQNTCCGSYDSVKIGGVFGVENEYLFYNGIPTNVAQIPQEGQATYKGEFLYSSEAQGRYETSRNTRAATFEVDFGNKTLNGKLDASMTAVTIEANITGNQFDGKAISVNEVVEGKVQGQFFGENAKQLGGLAAANDNTSWNAVFAAQKQ
ncbi:transferrin-binding protein-like solute binding protein [Pasteurellaceae bacterium USgator11]|nr:transferrin-binding protein-like solute binding protein [Pasteurellaceae bacterium UScroc12]TNG97309.1 transferrin-binding protein-like solute binding protein [Pasteurellaceae bacterium USgator41]TNG99852.1 transferrin-binding protein-like solute binding protein [Pasteurellaceae bacterium USgator11]TNH00800.1 transferrin-binding protein-like solute binding protein [Pasteurellaceae bacterium UScroc31]